MSSLLHEHAPSGNEHLRLLLGLVVSEELTICINSDFTFRAFITIGTSPVYIHITPIGSSIMGIQIHKPVCTNPATRLIFWTVFIKKHPEYNILFNEHYKDILTSDLKANKFIKEDCDSLEDMIKCYNTNICIGCSDKDTVENGAYPKISEGSCWSCTKYTHHLMLLAILQNEWDGKWSDGHTYLNYKGSSDKIRFVSNSKLSFRNIVDCGHQFRYIFGEVLKIMIGEKDEDTDIT